VIREAGGAVEGKGNQKPQKRAAKQILAFAAGVPGGSDNQPMMTRLNQSAKTKVGEAVPPERR